MSQSLQAIRGMNDILPADMPYWHRLESAFTALMHQHAIDEIRCPIVEKTDLFKRSIGDVTDIVEKEMYTFADRNGDSLTLRPEGTAQCVRAAMNHGLLRHETPRLWYQGPMFRHERPQKGRYRQFYQMGVEAFGVASPVLDAEMIGLTQSLWKALKIDSVIALEINTLGSPYARAAYRDVLVAYLRDHLDQLDEDSQRRLESNPLRILDSKNPDMQTLIEGAPQLLDHLDEESKNHFETLCAHLDAMDIPYRVNPRLVRGLDYYQKTVFEWVTTELGAQGTVCGGGRFDGLVTQLGSKEAVPALGFSLGIERLVELMKDHAPLSGQGPDVFVVVLGDNAERCLPKWLAAWRAERPDWAILPSLGGGSMKSQMKRADKSGARFAFIVGDNEAEQGVVAVKSLRDDQPQHVQAWDAVFSQLDA